MSVTAPVASPKFVAGFLGIPGSRLPKETLNTIKRAAKPPIRRGGKGMYSWLDILLMSLGSQLLNNGLSPLKTQDCISTVRDWIQSILEDPDLGTDKFDPQTEWRWLIGKQVGLEYSVHLGDRTDLVKAVTEEPSADAHLIINLYHFVARELKRLEEYEGKHPIA